MKRTSNKYDSAIINNNDEASLESYRDYCVKAAKELYYGKETIDKLSNAKTNTEISNIMKQARLNDKH